MVIRNPVVEYRKTYISILSQIKPLHTTPHYLFRIFSSHLRLGHNSDSFLHVFFATLSYTHFSYIRYPLHTRQYFTSILHQSARHHMPGSHNLCSHCQSEQQMTWIRMIYRFVCSTLQGDFTMSFLFPNFPRSSPRFLCGVRQHLYRTVRALSHFGQRSNISTIFPIYDPPIII